MAVRGSEAVDVVGEGSEEKSVLLTRSLASCVA